MKIYDTGIPLIRLEELQNTSSIAIQKRGINFLIIADNEDIFVIEDRCGHFGVSLKEGIVKNGQIRCPAHGARFDLKSGELVNDLFEQCDPVNVFLWRKKDGWLEVII